MEYPKTLYVVNEDKYLYMGIKQLVGRDSLEKSVEDNGQENEVAVYQLVSVNKFKKTVTKTAIIEEVK